MMEFLEIDIDDWGIMLVSNAVFTTILLLIGILPSTDWWIKSFLITIAYWSIYQYLIKPYVLEMKTNSLWKVVKW